MEIQGLYIVSRTVCLHTTQLKFRRTRGRKEDFGCVLQGDIKVVADLTECRKVIGREEWSKEWKKSKHKKTPKR